MPTYPHICNECQHEWDEVYSMNADPPDTCPACGTKGKVERLIAGGSGKGIVILTGNELKEQTKLDAAKIINESSKNENFLANMVGEQKYHNNELFRGKVRRRDY
jgi:putative FmdB family regulatory protein